mgnify:CR=1 FL=1
MGAMGASGGGSSTGGSSTGGSGMLRECVATCGFGGGPRLAAGGGGGAVSLSPGGVLGRITQLLAAAMSEHKVHKLMIGGQGLTWGDDDRGRGVGRAACRRGYGANGCPGRPEGTSVCSQRDVPHPCHPSCAMLAIPPPQHLLPTLTTPPLHTHRAASRRGQQCRLHGAAARVRRRHGRQAARGGGQRRLLEMCVRVCVGRGGGVGDGWGGGPGGWEGRGKGLDEAGRAGRVLAGVTGGLRKGTCMTSLSKRKNVGVGALVTKRAALDTYTRSLTLP